MYPYTSSLVQQKKQSSICKISYWQYFLIIGLLLSVLLCGVASCGDAGSRNGNGGPPLTSNITPPVAHKYLPTKAIFVGMDDTGSYSQTFFNKAKQKLISFFDQLLVPGSGDIWIFICRINANSFNTANV